MANTVYRLITLVSLFSLLHCAYSAAQHRFYLRLTEQPFVSLPIDVVAQTLISLVALIYGTSFLASPFQYIKQDQHHDRTCDEALNCPSFITFDNRAKAMSPEFAMLRALKQKVAAKATDIEHCDCEYELQQRAARRRRILGVRGGVERLSRIDYSPSLSQYSTISSSSSILSIPLSISKPISSYRFYSQKPSPSSLSSPFAEKSNKQSPNFNNLPGARVPKSVQNAVKNSRVLEITKEQADQAFNSCLQSIRKHDTDSYLSILLMPKRAQPEFVALNALNVELAQIRDKVDTRRGDTSAMYRLQFWKDAISSIYGLSPLPVPRQPVAIALCVFASSARSDLLLKLVESRQATIGDRQFDSIEALSEYGRSTTGSLLSLQVDALARISKTAMLPSVYDVAKDLGASYAIVNLIRSAHPLLARGIVIIPNDVMSLNGATPDSIYKKKKLEETQGVVRDLVKESRKFLDSARSQIDMVPPNILPALSTTASTIDYVIKTIEKNNFDIYCPHLQRRNPLLLWSLLWRKFTRKI